MSAADVQQSGALGRRTMRRGSAASWRLLCPDRHGSTAKSRHRQWPEIPSIERIGRIGIQQKDLILSQAVTAVPCRQRAAFAVFGARISYRHPVDPDGHTGSTDQLVRQRGDALQHRNAARMIISLVQKAPQNPRWIDEGEIPELRRRCGKNGIETDRNAGARVPDQPGCDVDGEGRQHGGADGCGKQSDRSHGVTARRSSQALCRGSV